MNQIIFNITKKSKQSKESKKRVIKRQAHDNYYDL